MKNPQPLRPARHRVHTLCSWCKKVVIKGCIAGNPCTACASGKRSDAFPAKVFMTCKECDRTRPWLENMADWNWTPIHSSLIEAMFYDERDSVLYLRFHGGGEIYKYTKVPANVIQSFLMAASKGKAYNTIIKGKFWGERVDESRPT